MRDFFHWEGTLPEWTDRFNRAVTEGAMVLAVSLSMRADIPSGPVALLVSKVDR